MKNSIIKKYRALCLAAGVLMGCIFPPFANIFMTTKSKEAGIVFVIACIAAGIAVGIVSYMIGKYTVLRTLLRMKKTFKRMSDGDFTHVCTIKSEDSIGELVDYLTEMRVSLKDLIGVVRNKSLDIGDHVEFNTSELLKLSKEIEEINQLAKTVLEDMNFVSDNAQTLSATSVEINTAIKVIANKASDGAFVSGEISQKAALAKTELEASINQAEIMFEHTGKRLETALVNVQVVNQIEVLLNTIIKVSSQTNMLALNASIEANRGGGSGNGNGFAVIANQIRQLSEESRENTEQITKVVHEVVFAVEELRLCSKDLLEFLSESVRGDYEKFRRLVEEYEKNSQYVEDIVVDLSGTSEELFASLQVVADRIHDISNLAVNSSSKVDSIFQEINKVNGESENLVSSTENLRDNAKELEHLVKEFKLDRV